MAAGLVFMVAGCASLDATRAQGEHFQGLADQATTHYGVGSIRVRISELAGFGGRYDRTDHTLTLVPSSELTMRLVLAHEIGHHILGHVGARLDQEEAATALAVHVLQLWGMSEEAAYRGLANKLLGAQQRHIVLDGHDWCTELADLHAHYPNYPPKDPARVNATCPGVGVPTASERN